MARALSLNVYRILGTAGDPKIEDLSSVLAEKDFEEIELKHAVKNAKTKLFVASSDARRPDWVAFLEEAYAALEISETNSYGALLVVESPGPGTPLFAFAFGQGRHLLRPGSYEQFYGLRVVLNLLSQPAEADGAARQSAIRSVDAKTVASNTLHTRRQTDRRSPFESFGVDTSGDLVRAITGHPVEVKAWGSRVTGADSLQLRKRLKFTELGALCTSIESMARQGHYKENYSWIDNIRTIIDPKLKNDLSETVVSNLRAGQTEHMQLAPPAVIDWEHPIIFKLSTDFDREIEDIDISEYVGTIDLDELTVEQLSEDKLVLCDDDGGTVDQWSIFRALSGEVEFDGKTYVLSEGHFYEVRQAYLDALDNYINAIAESDVQLPAWVGYRAEEEYNKKVAESATEFLLMDRRTIKMSTHTTPIEFCDLLTDDRKLVHVKPKGSSSTLSHLFAQGYVSGDLFLMSGEFREKALDRIRVAEAEAVGRTGNDAIAGRFSTFDTDSISARDYEIVFAIAGKWDGGNLASVLPFFSKVNLRRTVENLRRMGYGIGFKLVDRQ